MPTSASTISWHAGLFVQGARGRPRAANWLIPLLLLGLLLRTARNPVMAQTGGSNYWQYPASGRLHHVLSSDVNHDGIDEFLVVDESGKVDLLSSSGVLQWSYSFGEPVLALDTVNLDTSTGPEREIAVGTAGGIALLEASGKLLWQIPLQQDQVMLAESDDLIAQGPTSTGLTGAPIDVAPFDHDYDGKEEVLVLHESGTLQLYGSTGVPLWSYPENGSVVADTEPKMLVADFDGNGRSEVALGLFDPRQRFSQLFLIDGSGNEVWDQELSVSGRITVLEIATFSGLPGSHIAVANNLGQIRVYDTLRQRLWLRTLNKPITSMVSAPLSRGAGLVVGTSVGSLVAFDGAGRRTWTRYLAPGADRSIVSISTATSSPVEGQPAMAVIIRSMEEGASPADVALIDAGGRTVASFAAADTTGLTRLTDINRDNSSELLLARFAQLELLGLGLGASEIARGWDYNLFSEPRSLAVADLDGDGSDELFIGTQDGRIHSLDGRSSIRWLHAPGGAITHLGTLTSRSEQARVVAVRNELLLNPSDEPVHLSWLELRQANGTLLWERQAQSQINALGIGNLDEQGWPEIAVGTEDGKVMLYDASGELLQENQLNGGVHHLLALERNGGRQPELIAATPNQLFQIRRGEVPWRFAAFAPTIDAIYPLKQTPNEATGSLLVLLGDGTLREVTIQRGVQHPRWSLGMGDRAIASTPTTSVAIEVPGQPLSDSFVVAIESARLMGIEVSSHQAVVSWRLENIQNPTSLYWSDLDGDALSELAVGDVEGIVQLFKVRSNPPPVPQTRLDLSSSVFALAPLRSTAGGNSDLLAVTQNGLVQLFRAQENWPPLLTGPGVNASQNQYSIVISVKDVENDRVNVGLEVFDPLTGQWESQGEKQLDNGNGTLFWLLDDPPSSVEGVTFRFHYDDTFHRGILQPPPGPVPPPPNLATNLTPTSVGIVGAAGLILALILARQGRLPEARARRFFRLLTQQPDKSLPLLEEKYTYTQGSPDFLLHLAGRARQNGSILIAGLADGLFLLADQPHAGLPILLGVLEEASAMVPAWQDIERWRLTFRVAQALLEAPSSMELSLLHPQLTQLLDKLEVADQWSPALEGMLPVLTNLRDSQRVELAADRIVYLDEAAQLLSGLAEQLPELASSIERTLAAGIAKRWSGLVGAEIEDLHGRAELVITLKTKRLAPVARTEVVLEVLNSGRAPAENLVAELDQDPAYTVLTSPEAIRFLPPGRSRLIDFTIEPRVSDHFRLASTLTYDDRNRRDKVVAFADMVHLLPPARDFKPIANPYVPGTPLRRNSSIFYGRQELFNFISENAGDLAQRNVLILVGERRTGKTSVLLRLDQHLPGHLLPVYIDCQSLGVTPGMPALLHDLSWYLADALAGRGIAVKVPDTTYWQDDPTGRFQREFLPQVRSLLPEATTLMLVFDEFEAFENLVDDGILPPTLFPYLRHLMQHSEGLGFVFVGTRRLEEMSADYWSVLFNIALYRKIGYLSEESATQLICDPVRPNLVYDDLALDKILRVTSGHPYFLQLVCYTLVKRANAQQTGYATISDVNAAVDEMLRLGEVHFAYLWQRSTNVERALLMAMAHLMDRDAPFHATDLMQSLWPYELFLSPAEITAGLNRLVERDILREVAEGATSLYELKVGLIGLWVARYRSLSTLLIGNGDHRASTPQKA